MRKLLILGLALAAGIGVCRAEDEKIPLQGGLRWVDDVSNVEFIWNWRSCEPAWEFTEEAYNEELRAYTDYWVTWKDNKYPGTATLEVTGRGNYTGTLTLTFEVKKASNVPYSSDSHYSYWRNRRHVFYCDGFEAEEPWYVSSMSYADRRSMPIVEYRPFQTKDPLTSELPRENGKYEVWITWPESEVSLAQGPDSIGAFTVYDYNGQWNALKAIKEALMPLVPEGIEPFPMNRWNFENGPADIDGYNWSLGLAEDGSIETLYLDNINLQGAFPIEVFQMPDLKELRIFSYEWRDSKNILTGRLDDIVAQAAAEGMPALESIEILNVEYNELTGNIGRLASFFPKLKNLSCTGNRFAEIHPMVSPDIYLTYNYQRLDSVIHINVSHPDMEAIYAETPEICKYNHTGQEYSEIYGCNFEPYEAEWGFEIPNDPIITLWERASFYHYWIGSEYEFRTNGNWRYAVYYGYNGQEFPCRSFALDGGYGNNRNRMKMVITYDDYDVNMREGFNVADVQGAISYIGDLYFPSFVVNFTEADVVKDWKINVQDIALLITRLLEKEEAEAPQQARAKDGRESLFFVDATGRLCLSSAEPVSAFELTVRGISIPSRIEALDRLGMSYRVAQGKDYTRLVVYTFDSERNIPAGVLPLFDADNITYYRGMATDFDGVTLTKAFDGSTQGVGSIAAPADRQMLTVSGRTLHFGNMPLNNLSWRVVSAQGREVARGNAANGCCATADLGHLPAGVYVVVAEADGIAPRSIKIIIK